MRLPNAPAQYSAGYQSSVILELEQADNLNHKKNQDVEIGSAKLILRSPNGTRYQVVVSDAGVLSASAV